MELFLKGLENIGHFITLEDRCLEKEDQRIIQILVELDLREGILTKLAIEWGTWTFIQNMEFWNLPFRFGLCHEVGNLIFYCNFSMYALNNHKNVLGQKIKRSGGLEVLVKGGT
jgi:hypothetical protein